MSANVKHFYYFFQRNSLQHSQTFQTRQCSCRHRLLVPAPRALPKYNKKRRAKQNMSTPGVSHNDTPPASHTSPSPVSSPVSSPISPIMELLETTTTAICDGYFKCPAFSLHSHHRENTQTILYPLLLAATASYLSVSETSLSLESESHHTYSQNGPLVRHRGRLLGFIAGVELSALDRKNAKSNKQVRSCDE